MSIRSNLAILRSNLQKLTDRPVSVVAVTKNRSADEIEEAIRAGITHIGESRLQEAEKKLPDLPRTVTPHFIGRLQTNKIRDVVRLFDVIQSVDSLKKAQKISEECSKIGKRMPILIQVNTSNEAQKGGIAPEKAIELIMEASKLKNIEIRGLMTIAIHSGDKNVIRGCFRTLKRLFDQLKQQNIPTARMETLSMGMSDDYELAIEEGATMVRIGRRIFEEK